MTTEAGPQRRLPAYLSRPWRRLLRGVLPARIDFVYSPHYEVGFAGTPIDPRRGERILAFLFSEGLLRHRSLQRPPRASLKALRRVHADAYLESLHDMSALVPIVGYEPDDELGERALLAQRYGVGGTVLATRLALQRRRTAVHLGGGFHHASREAGRGFCIFNDVAVAIADARRRGFRAPILVLDLDLHDGNGTRAIFADDDSVFTFSIHNQTWDEAAARASLALELPGEVEDGVYLEAVREHLPRVLEEHQPRLVYYLAGTDPAHDDRIGNWRISDRGLLERDRFVVTELRRQPRRPALVTLLAGGYGSQTWRYSARFFAWLLSGRDDVEPPTTGEQTMARLRELARFLEVERRQADADEGLWSLSEEDVYGSLGEVSRRTRLLDFFTPHGIELILERSGLLDLLRAQGFDRPTVVFDLDNPAGQTLRLFGDADHRELLIEVRMARERAALEGFELLRLEWLLIQNPRRSFDYERPRLPGQSHPGMGLLRDVMALIVLLTEQLQLDGIFFVPSHYHLAAKGKQFLRFVDPDNEAWFRAMRDAVDHLELADATRAVRDGRVVDAESGETVEWRPMTMVLPLSARLHRRMESRAYERQVAECSRRYRFRLAATGRTPATGD